MFHNFAIKTVTATACRPDISNFRRWNI